MPEYKIIMPSKPKAVLEKGNKGVFEIDGLYPGYGHTLGNSLRRIILSSLPGASIVSIKIDGVTHEFQTVEGIKEDVITLILNLKKVRFKMITDETQTATISIKGPKEITAKDIEVSGQMEILNPDLYIATVNGKNNIEVELKVEKGLGFIPKEVIQKDKVEIGVLAIDAIFTPIRRVSYEVENMRVGDNTNYNRLRISIETDGTLSPREALSESILIMINQLKSIVDFKDEVEEIEEVVSEVVESEIQNEEEKEDDVSDILKTRIENLELSTRTSKALSAASIRTIGGLARKKKEDLLDIDGIGDKGINEIEEVLQESGLSLKE